MDPISRISKDGGKSATDILHDTKSLISEPKEEFEGNFEPEKVIAPKFSNIKFLMTKDKNFILFQWSVDFKLEMRKDKKDVSKIEEIEENRQATTATNVVYQEKEDHFELPQKLDNNVPLEEKAYCHST